MLRFPPADSPISKRYDPALVRTQIARETLPHIKDATESAKMEFTNPSLKSVSYVIRKGNGDAVLIEIKRSGTTKELWNFGQ